MTLVTFTIAYTTLFRLITAENTSGYITGVEDSRIDFPHSVLLHIKCNHTEFCGASILNLFTLLSAASCIETCTDSFAIDAYIDTQEGIKTRIVDFKVHEEYNRETFSNDIAVLILEDALLFGKEVMPVILLKEIPKYSVAIIAGWGWLNDNGSRSGVLQMAVQKVMSREMCVKEMGYIPVGTVCGFNVDKSTPKRGDPGDALMVHSIVQIGLASAHRRSSTMAVYTDVPYFYDWIRGAIRELSTRNFCAFCDTYLI